MFSILVFFTICYAALPWYKEASNQWAHYPCTTVGITRKTLPRARGTHLVMCISKWSLSYSKATVRTSQRKLLSPLCSPPENHRHYYRPPNCTGSAYAAHIVVTTYHGTSFKRIFLVFWRNYLHIQAHSDVYLYAMNSSVFLSKCSVCLIWSTLRSTILTTNYVSWVLRILLLSPSVEYAFQSLPSRITWRKTWREEKTLLHHLLLMHYRNSHLLSF